MRFQVSTDAKTDVVDVTDQVREAVPDGSDGTVTAFVRHTTAGVVVNEAEPRLLEDIDRFVAGLVPDEGWRHDELDGNADAHLRALLVGPDVTLPVRDGGLALGRWQSVLLVECDGPRTRTVDVVVRAD
ncbi:secondary thiamine-phosphate synthase enzyme YjbQ [Halorarius halobius]|uniref:secondary thiamine-phosphate synthase enzyme YjbQ n=1 Tax=Halorarius halobius TaxID=2962671 RepID=UPI0020CC0AA5|nr:secondary thiamine-phosphate synthase enzyme YjbQ [Halorarius halobius]